MKYFTLVAVSAAFSTLANAQTERDLDSHVHGAATLNVAIADSSVFIELDTPWNNLVGFEHSPSNEEQHALVDAALSQLNDPTQLFAFDGGDCTLNEVTVENAMAEESHNEEHGDEHDDDHKDGHDDDHKSEHDDDHDADHDDEHKDEHHDEHDDEHKDEHEDEHAHSDDHDDHDDSPEHSTVLVSYGYACEKVESLKTIDVLLFSLWTGFEELDVQLIGDGGQALVELNLQNTSIDIEQVQ